MTPIECNRGGSVRTLSIDYSAQGLQKRFNDWGEFAAKNFMFFLDIFSSLIFRWIVGECQKGEIESTLEKGVSVVLDLLKFAPLANAFAFPLLGGIFLLMSKLAAGEAARRAERRFLAALVLLTMVTVRTVMACDEAWLVHTATLSLLIVGALLIPSQESSVAV